MRLNIQYKMVSCLLVWCCIGQLRAQSSAPIEFLTVKEVIDKTLSTYPTIRQAEEAIRGAHVQLKLAESSYLPSIGGTASYTFLDPISKLTMGEKTVHIQSKNNLSFGVSLSQLIWDFGRTQAHVEVGRLQQQLAELQKNKTQQDLALQAIRSYYMTLYARKSIDMKERQLEDFKQMLQQTEVRRNTGSATNFDYLNTHAGLKAVETELIALRTAKERQYVSLSLLTDTVVNDHTGLNQTLPSVTETRTLDELIAFACDHRFEMRIMHQEYRLAVEQRRANFREYNPTLSAGASVGFKSGYEPSLEDIRFNYSLGATLHVPIYESGRRSKQNALGKVQINQAMSAIELAKKEITSEVADSYLSLVSAQARIAQLVVQENVSQEAYAQAKVNYASGAITNLELLTSNTNAINSSLQLLQEQINCQISYSQLLMSIGELLYQPQ